MIARRQQRGYLLVTVIITLFLIASIAALLAHDSASSANTSNRELETARAEYVAEAGMQHALWRAQNNACMGDVTIPATMLGSDSYTATITGAAAGTFSTLSADQDAWIRNDDVTKNNGGGPDQEIRFETGNIEQALTRFDLSSLPAGAQINSATAWFYVTPSGPGGGAHPEGPITVHRVTADWTETGVTWENMNGNFESSRLATIPAQPADAVWVSINLTAQVQAWVNGQPNYGILMRSVAEGVHGKYSSREDGGNAPRLEVVVGSGPASPVNIQVTGTLDNGVTRTLSRPVTTAYQPPVIYTVSPGPAESDDAEIWDQAPDNNYGNAAETWVSSASNDTSRSLLRFNTAAIPAGARILEATLFLTRQSGSGADQPVSAHRITNSWSEDSVTWNSREAGINWDNAGGDFDNRAVATTPVGPANQRYEWNITPMVQGWVDGSYPNYGVEMVGAIAGMPGERFYTSDQAVLDRRPGLSVSYACECGSACMAPQGTGTIAMVVVNPTTLVPADAYNKALFESWGYTVDVIGESENQAAYDAKSATSDVFFISETVNSNQVGNRLINMALGVVSQDGSYNSDLGLATGEASPVGSAINVSDNSHYITQVFATGPLDIYTADMAGMAVAGTEAPGLQTLGDWSGAGGPVVLNTGAVLGGSVSGGNAAGRRVLLPIGNNIDMSKINNNGHLIMQRALAWGMGLGGVSTGNLLLVVGNATTPSSADVAHKTLMESWGYTVSLIDDGDSQSSFDAAVASNDVVYITEDVSAASVGTKLVNSAIGVVTEEDNLSDEFGLADSIHWQFETALNIVDNSQYITQPFPLGPLTVLTTSLELADLTGALAPDLLALGNSAPGPALVAVGAGTSTINGTAAGRRVQLPWGANAFEINFLNPDGLTILKRALEWGSGIGCESQEPVVLIVGDASSPTSPEIARMDLLKSWCFGVTLLTAAAPSDMYDKVADFADIVYVPATVSFSDVTDKLKFQPFGVVNEVSALSGYLGFTSGASSFMTRTTTIVDNTHPITASFNTGDLTITSTNQNMHRLINTLGPGFRKLSTRPSTSDAMLMTLDIGDELLWGGVAAGRRVMLPWGMSSFDVNTLTEDGETLLRHALEWAGNAYAPIAHWKMDDGSGITVVDSVGGHHGTLPNGGTWTTGKVGGALQFNGTNQYINVPHDNTLSLARFSISAWIRPDTVSGYHAVMYKGASTAEANYHLYTDDDEIVLGLTSGGWQYQILTTSANLVAGQWYHLTTTFDGTSGEGKHYLDGSLIHTGTIGAAPVMNTGPLTIGTDPFDEDWDGLLDDVRIYDRVLDAAEIAALAASGSGGGGGSGSCSGTFRDEFNAVSYSGSDGTLTWAGDWLEVNESDGPTKNDERVFLDNSMSPPMPSYQLFVRDNDGGGEGVMRSLDLSGATTATLSFDYKPAKLDNSGDYASVQMSSTGAGGPWSEVARFAGPADETAYQAFSTDISKFISADSVLRIMTSPKMGGADYVFFDNVQIACAP